VVLGEFCKMEKPPDSASQDKVKVLASKDSWIEGEALRQLHRAAEMPGVIEAVGMPDIHPGKGNPVGAVFITRGIIYPYLVGNDVGCGMGFWKTSQKRKKIKLDKWVKKLSGLEIPWNGECSAWLSEHGIDPASYIQSLGTIGGGNHFAELQVVDKIYDQTWFDDLQLDKNHLMLLVHSGSRGVGEALLRKHTDQYGAKGLLIDSEDGLAYLDQHDYAMKWAEANRSLIAHRFSAQIGGEIKIVMDIWHNGISRTIVDGQVVWIHRKGAAPSDVGPLIIPGTRGSLSYLVVPQGDQRPNAWSVAHGAGRKWNRSTAKGQMKSRFTAKSLIHTELGSRVICEDKDLLFEEAPQAYKKIEMVIDDMLQAGLISIIATFKPLITYKVRKK
jgi:release factor H-coupled RctB family protein